MIEQAAGETLAVQNLHPIAKRQVGRADEAGAFVGLADDVEEQFRAGLAERDISQFVEDD